MKRKTLAALKKSIKHWERNIAAETHSEVSIGAADCPLCLEFIDHNPCHPCVGCPVMKKTGRPRCFSTPYYLARDVYWSWRDGSLTREAWRAEAQDELDFLKSLLPTGA